MTVNDSLANTGSQTGLPAALLPAQDFNVRLLAYLSFAATLATGVFTEVFPYLWSILAVGLVVHPLLTHCVLARLRQRYPRVIRRMLGVTDAAVFGSMLVILGLGPLLTLLLLIIAVASFIIAGRISAASTAALALLAGGAVTFHYLPDTILRQPNESMHFTAVLFAAMYVWVSAYYMRLLAQTLQHAQADLRQQADQHRELSLQVSKYIAPQVWKTILSGKKGVKLGSTRKRLVVFFSDLKGFTQLSDQLEPDTLTLIIN